MDTDSMYSTLAETELYDCIRSDKSQEWEHLCSKDCNDSFTADACRNFFPRTCCAKLRKHDRREHRLFKEEFRCTECFNCKARQIAVTTL